jgi:AcrR family transcriptional regulator
MRRPIIRACAGTFLIVKARQYSCVMSRDVVISPPITADGSALPTRDVLINAAMPVFRSKGYELTTVDDIARSAGLTTGAIYASFASKDELFYAAVSLVEDRFESWVQAGVRELPRSSSDRDRLAAYLHATVAILQAEPDLMAFRSSSWVDLARQPEIGRAYGSVQARRREFLLGQLKGARMARRSSVSREDLVDVILMAAEGIASVQIDSLIPKATAMATLTSVIEHLLLGDPIDA